MLTSSLLSEHFAFKSNAAKNPCAATNSVKEPLTQELQGKPVLEYCSYPVTIETGIIQQSQLCCPECN